MFDGVHDGVKDDEHNGSVLIGGVVGTHVGIYVVGDRDGAAIDGIVVETDVVVIGNCVIEEGILPIYVGSILGVMIGIIVGNVVGSIVGSIRGIDVATMGCILVGGLYVVGECVGIVVGLHVGLVVITNTGYRVGIYVGITVGLYVGIAVGLFVGTFILVVGIVVGDLVAIVVVL